LGRGLGQGWGRRTEAGKEQGGVPGLDAPGRRGGGWFGRRLGEVVAGEHLALPVAVRWRAAIPQGKALFLLIVRAQSELINMCCRIDRRAALAAGVPTVAMFCPGCSVGFGGTSCASDEYFAA